MLIVNPEDYVGKYLVLLEANPLDDIGNTQRIAAVIVDEKLLPRKSLQRILANAKAAASRR